MEKSAYLWKVTLTDLNDPEPFTTQDYVIASDAITAGQIVLDFLCGDTPHIKSIEYVGDMIFLDNGIVRHETKTFAVYG